MSKPEYQWSEFAVGSMKHIAPVIDGEVAFGHLLTAFCPCGATPDRADSSLILHHEDGETVLSRTH